MRGFKTSIDQVRLNINYQFSGGKIEYGGKLWWHGFPTELTPCTNFDPQKSFILTPKANHNIFLCNNVSPIWQIFTEPAGTNRTPILTQSTRWGTCFYERLQRSGNNVTHRKWIRGKVKQVGQPPFLVYKHQFWLCPIKKVLIDASVWLGGPHSQSPTNCSTPLWNQTWL